MSKFKNLVNKRLQRYYGYGEKRLKGIERSNIEAIQNDYINAYNEIESLLTSFMKRYDNYDEMIAYKRLEKMQKQIGESLKLLGKQNVRNLKDFTGKAVMDGFNTHGFSIMQGTYGSVYTAPMTDQVVALNKLNDYQKITWLDSSKDNDLITIKRINSTISENLIEGSSIAKTTQALQKQTNMAYYRMERIARTEIHRAQTFGAILNYEDVKENSDMGVKKIWKSANDPPRVRPNHLAMNNVAADKKKDDKFTFTTMKNNRMLVDGPGVTNTTDDIQCRCTVFTEFTDVGSDFETLLKENELSYEDYIKTKQPITK